MPIVTCKKLGYRMKLNEKQIEDLIYKSPWLLDERYSIPKVEGSGGWGRQIDIGKGNNRFIDLLFKDNRDQRPVIIELKKGKLVRENIAQILEYRALLISLDDELKEAWKSEFECNFYIPKLVLIGTSADEETIISANLAGIDLRFFGDTDVNNLKFNTFEQLQVKIKEWEQFRSSGARTLIERSDWIKEIIDLISRFANAFSKVRNIELSTIDSIPKLNSSQTKLYLDYEFPFLNIPILYKGEQILGLYEYYDEHTPFSDEYIYIEIPYLWNTDDDLFHNAILLVKEFEIDPVRIEYDKNEYGIPVFIIDRTVIQDQIRFKTIFDNLISLSLKIFNEIY